MGGPLRHPAGCAPRRRHATRSPSRRVSRHPRPVPRQVASGPDPSRNRRIEPPAAAAGIAWAGPPPRSACWTSSGRSRATRPSSDVRRSGDGDPLEWRRGPTRPPAELRLPCGAPSGPGRTSYAAVTLADLADLTMKQAPAAALEKGVDLDHPGPLHEKRCDHKMTCRHKMTRSTAMIGENRGPISRIGSSRRSELERGCPGSPRHAQIRTRRIAMVEFEYEHPVGE